MSLVLELRERIISVCSRYEQYIVRAVRFLEVFLCLICINRGIGYDETLSGMLPTVLISLICTLLPGTGAVVILAVVLTVHLYALALEAALVGGCLFLILLLLYFRFSPKDTALLFLYPVCNAAGVSYALPVAGGLLYGPASGVTVAAGVVVQRFLRFVAANETVLAGTGAELDAEDMIARFQYLIDGLMGDRVMLVRAAAVIIAGLLVYYIRRLSIPWSWIIASGAGAVIQLVVLLIGALAYDTDISIAATFLGVAAAFAVGVVISFFMFNLDYSRVENTQFEDDQYYYYVKAVPKNVYARQKRTVKTINTHRRAPQEPARDGQGYGPEEYKAGGNDDGYAPDGYTPERYEAGDYATGDYVPDGYASGGYAPDGYAPEEYEPAAYERPGRTAGPSVEYDGRRAYPGEDDRDGYQDDGF